MITKAKSHGTIESYSELPRKPEDGDTYWVTCERKVVLYSIPAHKWIILRSFEKSYQLGIFDGDSG